MVNAQEWLDREYLEKWEKKYVWELHLNELDLEGELDLADFQELKKIYISHYIDENKLEIKNKDRYKITKLVYVPNAQEYLDKNYPEEERKDIRKLDLSNLDLEGDLDLEDFTYIDIEGNASSHIIHNILKVYLTGNPRLGTIKIKSKDVKVYLDAQVLLNRKHPSKEGIKKIWYSEPYSGELISGELIIADFPQLEEIGIPWNYNLTKLQINNCLQLTKLNCSQNKLTELIITNCPNLQDINVSCNQTKQNLSFLKGLLSLKKLNLSDNCFTGSLEFLYNCRELEELDISDTNISHGLEYLPKSIEKLECSFTKRPEAQVSDIWEELQPFGGNIKKWREVKWDKKIDLITSPLLPPQLTKKIKPKNKLQENHDIKGFDYDKLYFNQWGEIKFLTTWKLPTKLYNILEDKVEKTKENPNIKNYAILSYVWGNPNEDENKLSEEQKKELDDTTIGIGYKNSDLLTRLGYKSWKKAIRSLKTINKEKHEELDSNTDINHLWIDQLCINQKDNEEKSQEVPKMRQYYDNSSITLISINANLGEESDHLNILKRIINSEWFTRSWTFQEGWLSKHTVFMFDDKLIDGWAMAGTWALNQLGYANEGRYLSRREFEKGTKKIATPVGWVYYRNGYNLEGNEEKNVKKDKVEMTLNQALRAIKKRGRGVPVDGIYSILGLLPYGDKVKPRYKKWGESYTKEELNQALYEVMKVAMGCREKIEPESYTLKRNKWGREAETIKKSLSDGRKLIEYWDGNGYGEPLAWHGASNTAPSLCWMPQIYEDGSTSVEGGIDVSFNDVESFFEEGKSLELYYSGNYKIHKANSTVQKLEGGFEIEGGLYKKDVEVKPIKIYEFLNEILKLEHEGKLEEELSKLNEEERHKLQEEIKKAEEYQPIPISLLGTRVTLELVKENKHLLVPERDAWLSKKLFALLTEDTGKKHKKSGYGNLDIYHRLGLVELGNGEKLKEVDTLNRERIIIGTNPQEHQQSHQEIPPKNS